MPDELATWDTFFFVCGMAFGFGLSFFAGALQRLFRMVAQGRRVRSHPNYRSKQEIYGGRR